MTTDPQNLNGSRKMKIAALGRTHWLYHSIRAIQENGHEVVLIGTAKGAPEYRADVQDFERLARKIGCPFFCDAELRRPEVVEQITASDAEIAVSVNWPTIIRRATLDLFPRGILNLHAGDLPKYRGNACPNWAILAGEPEVVLTVHQMSEQLDAGPIWAQCRCSLTEQTYIGDVYDFIENHAPVMFVQAIEKIVAGRAPTVQPDDPALALRCYPRRPSDGAIDWEKSAQEIAALVRASAEPFAGAFSYLNDEPIIVWRAYADTLPFQWFGIPGQVAELRRAAGEVAVLTGGGVLVLQQVSPADKVRRPAIELIRSTRLRLGADLVEQSMRLRAEIEELRVWVQELQSGPPRAKDSAV